MRHRTVVSVAWAVPWVGLGSADGSCGSALEEKETCQGRIILGEFLEKGILRVPETRTPMPGGESRCGDSAIGGHGKGYQLPGALEAKDQGRRLRKEAVCGRGRLHSSGQEGKQSISPLPSSLGRRGTSKENSLKGQEFRI